LDLDFLLGKVTLTLVFRTFPSNKCPTAKQQAVAQVPVVKPVRRGCCCSLDSGHITQINLIAALV
jgi:hypothetical protein